MWRVCLVAWVVGCEFPKLDPVAGGDMGIDAPIIDAPIDAPIIDAPPLLPPAIGPSCQSLATTCGASGTDGCCNPGKGVAGGTYYRSYDQAGDGSSGNQSYPATVSGFWLDKYEVTVGRFRKFVLAGKGTQASAPASGAGAHPGLAGSGWDTAWNASLAADQAALIAAVKCNATFQTWTDTAGANESRPMNCITWYEAMAFCLWDGGYLPTEAEWNYAATGGSEQRAYPWSNPAGTTALDGTRASYSEGPNCVGDGMAGCAVTDLVRAGSKGAAGEGRWEQSDLAGNVWEWNLDSPGVYATPCTNCAQLGSGTGRVLRGGGFNFDPVRAGYRFNDTPAGRYSSFGVRCARTR